jgi:hypothetical protein
VRVAAIGVRDAAAVAVVVEAGATGSGVALSSTCCSLRTGCTAAAASVSIAGEQPASAASPVATARAAVPRRAAVLRRVRRSRLITPGC